MAKKAFLRLMAVIITSASLLFSSTGECAEKLNVLTTHTVLKSIGEEVGKQHVSVSCLATGKEDPHAIQAKPSYMVNARKADLLIIIGMEMEIGYEQLVIDGSRNNKIRFGQPGYLDVSLNVLRREVPTTRVDRSMGDVHPLGNPHYWMDPYNARIVAQSIAERLAQLDPDNAAEYRANCADFMRRIDSAMFGEELVKEFGSERLWSLALAEQLDAFLKEKARNDAGNGWYQQLQPYRGKQIITYHRSWGYFAERFGLTVVAELEPKPGIPPSPGHLLQVVQIAQRHSVPVIVMEPYYSIRAADFVAEKTGAKVLEVTNAVGGQPGVNDYVSLIDSAVKKLKDALAESSEGIKQM
ncbi:MAG: zinc ABC transporter substrate-binding protein [Candidatus Abyssobacteria bacterium SURF_17]|uniref:Zinc ABC transporter substrate-binding protein n=1 Tax=Candidatus Abyssobacteria bacterium SURF_17 TaxID=2093361 RepID=A0A419EPY1_9BACT|nr:MAG: zinc ABC transporter substrate-binding protein [Candidatus Abyssubacteria bacterium SURF_17]